jgi:hypothetical protein
MSDPLKHLYHLSVEIGPRPPTSTAEARGAEYCRGVLEGAGIPPRLEPFRGLPSFGHTYIPIALGAALGALTGTLRRRHALVGGALGGASLAAFWGESTSRWRPVSTQLARGPSQNVVGVLDPGGEPRRRLVLAAHVDSSRSGWMFHPRLAPSFRQGVLTAAGAGAASLAAWGLPRPLRRLVSAGATAVFLSNLALLVQREVYGGDVDGANDNASGTAVQLALAQALAADPPRNTEVWFVFTGCEESDLIGMRAFIDRHASELEDAYFLGFDTVAGTGATLKWTTASGMLEVVRADPYLIRLAEETAAAHPGLGAEPGIWRTAGLDTDVAAVRGFKALSLMALTPEGTLPNWHWTSDTADNIDEDTLENCFTFALELVRRFDDES